MKGRGGLRPELSLNEWFSQALQFCIAVAVMLAVPKNDGQHYMRVCRHKGGTMSEMVEKQ